MIEAIVTLSSKMSAKGVHLYITYIILLLWVSHNITVVQHLMVRFGGAKTLLVVLQAYHCTY